MTGQTTQTRSRPTPGSQSRQPLRPYPGLRPFDDSEARIFFGRDRHRDEILERLAESSFVAVIGPSGCGKSSLMRAGVIPALRAGRFYRAGTSWLIADMRPQNRPAWNLADALDRLHRAPDDDDYHSRVLDLSTALFTEPDALREHLAAHGVDASTNVLLLVDQFEELFNAENEAQQDIVDEFMDFVLRVYRKEMPGVHCIITMRTDHLGDCAAYPELADAINETFYLTPNLREDELRQAIELPARLRQFNGAFQDDLVDRILADMRREEADQLPLMQHVMMRMWEAASGAAKLGARPLLTHDLYTSFGGISRTIDVHAEEILKDLTVKQRDLVEILFRQLTVRREGATYQDVRRPTLFKDIAAVAGLAGETQRQELRNVIDTFRRPDVQFLQPQYSAHDPVLSPIGDETRIDIVHECLIRKWHALSAWVVTEWECAKNLRELVDHATAAREVLGPLSSAPLSIGERLQHSVTAARTWARDPRDMTDKVSALGKSAATSARELKSTVKARLAEAARPEGAPPGAAADALGAKDAVVGSARVLARKFGDVGQKLAPQVKSAMAKGEQILRELKGTGLSADRLRSASWTPLRTASSYLGRHQTNNFMRWWEGQRPTEAWAKNYRVDPPAFDYAKRFLAHSVRRHRNSRLRQLGAWAAGLAAVSIGGTYLFTDARNREAAERNELALNMKIASQMLPTTPSGVKTYQDFLQESIAPRLPAKDPRLNAWMRAQADVLIGYPDVFMIRDDAVSMPLAAIDRNLAESQLFALAASQDGSVTALATDSHVTLVDRDGRRLWSSRHAIPIDQLRFGKLHHSTRDGQVYLLSGGCKVQMFARTDGAASEVRHPVPTALICDASPDGRRIAVVDREGSDSGVWKVRILDSGTLQATAAAGFELPFPATAVRLASFDAAASERLGLVFDWRHAAVLDVSGAATGRVRLDWSFTVPNSARFDRNFTVSADGGWVAGANGREVHLWNRSQHRVIEEGGARVTIPHWSSYLHESPVTYLAFTSTAELVTIEERGDIALHNYLLSARQATRRALWRARDVGIATIDARGEILLDAAAPAGERALMRLGLADQWYGRRTIHDEQAQVTAVALAPSAPILALGRDDGDVSLLRLAETPSGTQTRIAHTRSGPDELWRARSRVGAIAVSSRADVVAGVRADGTIVTLARDPVRPEYSGSIERPANQQGPRQAALAADGSHLAVIDGAGKLHLFERLSRPAHAGGVWRRTGVSAIDFGAKRPVCAVGFASGGGTIAAGTSDGGVYIARAASATSAAGFELVASYPRRSISSVGISSDSAAVAVGLAGTGGESCADAAGDSTLAVALLGPRAARASQVTSEDASEAERFVGLAMHPLGNIAVLTSFAERDVDRRSVQVRLLDLSPTILGIQQPLANGLRWIDWTPRPYDTPDPASSEGRAAGIRNNVPAQFGCGEAACWLVSATEHPSRIIITPHRRCGDKASPLACLVPQSGNGKAIPTTAARTQSSTK